MVSSIFTLCTYNILFFGVAQLSSLTINPTPAFPEIFHRSAFTGLMFGFAIVLLITARFFKVVW